MSGRRREKLDDRENEDTASVMSEIEIDDTEASQITKDLVSLILDDSSKVNKGVGKKILALFHVLEEQNKELRIKNAYLQGRVDERKELAEKLEQVAASKESYATKVKQATVLAPKIGVEKVTPQYKKKTVILYPENPEGNGTSERTLSAIKAVLAPQKEKIQIKKIVNIRKGGVVIEAGTEKTATLIKEVAQKAHGIKCVDKKLKRPRVIIYDVDDEMSMDEMKKCLYTQNLQEKGHTEEEVNEGIKLCHKTGNKNADTSNWIVECSPQIRENLIRLGRVYLNYSSCKVKDYLVVVRCFNCQEYGHLSKYCKSKKQICSKCGSEGHGWKDCKKNHKEDICIHCKAAKKDAKHKIGTMKCPIYANVVKKLVGTIQYK